MRTDNQLLALPLLLLLHIGCMTGCRVPQYTAWPANAAQAHALPPADVEDVRALPMFSGFNGSAIHWDQLLEASAWADVILLGEQHDDAVAHAVQLAIVEDVLNRWPRSAVAMEMLTRDHQHFVDDYLNGIIDAPMLVRLAGVANWAGPGSWNEWYQPIVDAAKERGARVIAANAPRRYVRLARTGGYSALHNLPRERRSLVDLPGQHHDSDYRSRFIEVMQAMSATHTTDTSDDNGNRSDEGEGDGNGNNDDEAAPARQHLSIHRIDAIFRSQLVWDATMARSILRANPTRAAKVIHLCGRFHSDFEGGTVLEIRRRRPWLRILTVSMAPKEATALLEADRNRADIVIYTGARDEPLPEHEDDDDREADNDTESPSDDEET